MVRDDRDLLLEFPCHSHKRLCFGSLFDNWFFRRGRSRLILKFHPDLQQFFKTRVVRCCNRACIVIFRWIRERTFVDGECQLFLRSFFLESLKLFLFCIKMCLWIAHSKRYLLLSQRRDFIKRLRFGQLLRKIFSLS